ncbi:MAG: adaptor protein MecA [Lachnospiraceae bacterium]|nr:adaptor protein MecA [Lachnospiraceae bacterium]MEE1256017.1 adaptor protein MecA [Lachnospiraceae bacterium]
MEYKRLGDLKVSCIASSDDLDFFGVVLDDLLDRTQQGYQFIKKVKELAGMNQKIVWTNIAYTLQISMLEQGKISLTYSEEIPDYIESLKHSMVMADQATMEPLKEFISTLEKAEEEDARKLVARFERNVRHTKEN